MHDGDGVAEALDEAAGRLRRERDLGNEHDRRVPALERGRDGPQVDLGLAAAGDAVQQQRRAAPGTGRAASRSPPGRRPDRRSARSAPSAPPRCETRPPRRLERVLEPQEAAPLEAAQRRVIAARAAAELGRADRPPRSSSSAARWRVPSRSAPASAASPTGVSAAPQRAPRDERPRRPGSRPGRQHEREPARRRGYVLARHPQSERHERLRHVRLEGRQRLREPLRRQLALLGHADDDAEQAPTPERHDEHAADPHRLELALEPVVERPAQGARRGERLDLGDHVSEATVRAGRRSRAPKRRRCRRGDRLRGGGAPRRARRRAGPRCAPRAAAHARARGLHAGGAAPRDGEDRLALLPVERVLEAEGPRHTLREVAAESGLELGFLEEARRALGDPAVDPDARVLTDEELELARHAKTLLDAGLDEESFFELIRVMSHSLDSIASALVATLGQALLQPGDTERDLGLRYSESLRMLAPLAGPALELILNRRLREQIREAVIGRAELESGRLPGAQRIVVAFVDIVGFTELGEQVPADELGAVVRDFERRVEAAVQPPVRLVKTIGDAAMLVATEPDPLLDAVLGLVDDSVERPRGLLLRGGVAAGEALQRAGDFYGSPVNLAQAASPRSPVWSVVATAEVKEARRGDTAGHAGRHRLSVSAARRGVGLSRAHSLARVSGPATVTA